MAADGGADGGADAKAAEVWAAYARTRPDVASTPALEAAATIVRNRHGIVADAQRRRGVYTSVPYLHGVPPEQIDEALRALVALLVATPEEDALHELLPDARSSPRVAEVAAYLDERMCVPRDMGAPPAREIRLWREKLCHDHAV